jgi:hypothetical protein
MFYNAGVGSGRSVGRPAVTLYSPESYRNSSESLPSASRCGGRAADRRGEQSCLPSLLRNTEHPHYSKFTETTVVLFSIRCTSSYSGLHCTYLVGMPNVRQAGSLSFSVAPTACITYCHPIGEHNKDQSFLFCGVRPSDVHLLHSLPPLLN